MGLFKVGGGVDGNRGPETTTRVVVRSRVDNLATCWTSKVRNQDASMGHRSLHADDFVWDEHTIRTVLAVEWKTEESR